MMYASIAVACSSVSAGCAGIATGPHTPDPPSRIFRIKRAVAVVSSWYLRATRLYAGPIDLRLSWWHDRQSFPSTSARPRTTGLAAAAAPAAGPSRSEEHTPEIQ